MHRVAVVPQEEAPVFENFKVVVLLEKQQEVLEVTEDLLELLDLRSVIAAEALLLDHSESRRLFEEKVSVRLVQQNLLVVPEVLHRVFHET